MLTAKQVALELVKALDFRHPFDAALWATER